MFRETIFYLFKKEDLNLQKLLFAIKLYSCINLTYLFYFQNASICIAFSVYSTIVVSDTLAELLQQPDQFADFTALADLNKSNNNFIAVCVFLAWVKLFKYISFNKTMTQLSSTLSRVS